MISPADYKLGLIVNFDRSTKVISYFKLFKDNWFDRCREYYIVHLPFIYKVKQNIIKKKNWQL